MRDRLHRADIDRDGMVTYQEARQEFPDMTEERFKRFDRSGDGCLTMEDVPKRGERPSFAERIRIADANGDGSVSFEEARAEFPNLDEAGFKRLDGNGDGVLTKADAAKAMRGGAAASDPAQANAAAKALTADGNGDGKVSFEELIAVKPGYPREAFDRIDQNKDGSVSEEEAAKAR
jgi:Ca2+-binding EF-hand superfamily protein